MVTNNSQSSQNNLPVWVWVLLAIPVFLYPFLNKPKTRSHALDGHIAPTLSFKDMSGETHQLSEYRGKVILLNFWASWCGPCMSEMESLKKLHQDLEPKGVEVLAVNIEETPEHIASIHPAIKATLPPLVFHSPPSTELDPYRVSSLPMSLLIDKEGKILKIFYGAYRWDSKNFAQHYVEKLN